LSGKRRFEWRAVRPKYYTAQTTEAQYANAFLTMDLRSYISGKSSLLSFFKAATVRRRLNSARAEALPDSRIASATEEINHMSDDVGKAVGRPVQSRADQPPPCSGQSRNPGIESAEADLTTQARFLDTLLDNLPFGVAVHTMKAGAQGRYLLWNEANELLFGVNRDQALGKSISEVMPTDVTAQIEQWDRQLLASPSTQDVVTAEDVPGRGRLILRRIRVPIFDTDGQVEYLLAMTEDITAAQTLADETRLASKVFETTADGIIMSDADDRVIMVNAAFLKLTGFAPEEMLGKLLVESPFRPIDAAAFEARNERLARDGFVTGEVARVHKDGTPLSLWITKTCVRNDADSVVNYVRVFSDISPLKETQRKLEEEMHRHKLAAARVEYLAYHDSLTSLPNRGMFSKLLNQAISEARRYGRQLALLFVDLDRFKNINDALGHAAGDLLLQEVAKRLKGCLRESDAVGRLGGDEFVVLLPHVENLAYAGAVAHKILNTISKSFAALGQEFHVTASIGISMFPGDGDEERTLMKNADTAMYQAKEEGKNNFQFYFEALNANSFERLSLESSLRRALERGEFQLHYQPKINMSSGRIVGMEALIRWAHPELGMVAPTKFIPVAEETGLIVPIGKWVLRTACSQNVAWQNLGLPHLSMAVNLSARQFLDANLLRDIKASLVETGMSPRLLELEITESMLMHNLDNAMRILTNLRAMGIRIAVDDFGTGYSSLSNLKRFPIDTIKVDRSFIRKLPTDPENRGITEAILAMAKVLNLNVIAEGVETKEQADYLRELSCDEFQGFYFSKAVTASEFAELLGVQVMASAHGDAAVLA
jgi:diguanylate cyclase (GGDEF)-like protein/PAS domain S-box-containing protein